MSEAGKAGIGLGEPFPLDEAPEARMSVSEDESAVAAHPAAEMRPSVFSYSGLARTMRIPACFVTRSDLRRLYKELSEKSDEALERHLKSVEQLPNATLNQLEELKSSLRAVGRLRVRVLGASGEETVADSGEALEDDRLPSTVKSIEFDSAAALRRYNAALANSFRLVLDLAEPPNFYSYNPWEQPTPNVSRFEISGPDRTWVTGVYEAVSSFFKERSRRRGWFHSHTSFNILHWLVGFPAALWTVFRIDTGLASVLSNLHSTLRGAAYLYVLLLALLLFRSIIGALRWTFPLVELEAGRSKVARHALGAVAASLGAALVYDVLETLF